MIKYNDNDDDDDDDNDDDTLLNLTYIGNSDWPREFSPYTKSCEVDRITRYLQHILHLSTPAQSLPGFQAP